MNYFPALSSTDWGYYADGFFDRRLIVNSVGDGIVLNAAVSYGDNIAYIGMLFFNSTTGASLFMPAAGFREGKNGANPDAGLLFSTGSAGRYWSYDGTIDSNTSAYYLTFLRDNISAGAGQYVSVAGFSVRCIMQKDPI
jgi:hypothetical protein